jgi:hypothetical protein
MNLLFCTCPENVYGFFTADPYQTKFAPFPPLIDKVPDYTGCVDDNNRALKCAKHALDKKTRADIVTMNAALTNVFLDTLSSQVRASFQQRRLRKPNIVHRTLRQDDGQGPQRKQTLHGRRLASCQQV